MFLDSTPWYNYQLSGHRLHSHGGRLSRAVVAQERGDLALVEVDAEIIDGQFVARLVDLVQVADGGPPLQVSWILLKVRVF